MSEILASLLVVLVWITIISEMTWGVNELVKLEVAALLETWVVICLAVTHFVLAVAWRLWLSVKILGAAN